MDSHINFNIHEGMIEELRQCASILSKKLESDEFEEASQLIHSLTKIRDKHIFQSVGKLTRGLHSAIVNFNVDGDYQSSVKDDCELNDASSRLEYVINLTQTAADKTMDIVEACTPISIELGKEATSLKREWARLSNREMSPDEFRELYKRLDVFFEQLDVGFNHLNKNLQSIILEQGFQDLTGQVLQRVIGLVSEVEENLVQLVRVAGQVEGVVGIADEDKVENQEKVTAAPNIKGEGPQHKVEHREDLVSGQDDVDDLLSSLGF